MRNSLHAAIPENYTYLRKKKKSVCLGTCLFTSLFLKFLLNCGVLNFCLKVHGITGEVPTAVSGWTVLL